MVTYSTNIVQHFLGRGFQGKAMVVSIDKATALRMHDKVRKHWQTERVRVEAEISRLTTYGTNSDPDRLREFQQRLEVLTTTDMALIVSPGQNEVEQMKALGLDIVPHRQRMNAESLDERFKDAKDPLRLVFLCAIKDLLALSRALSEEQQRHVREQLTEDELTVFDLLTRPGPDLSPLERDEVKKVARHLLERVRASLYSTGANERRRGHRFGSPSRTRSTKGCPAPTLLTCTSRSAACYSSTCSRLLVIRARWKQPPRSVLAP